MPDSSDTCVALPRLTGHQLSAWRSGRAHPFGGRYAAAAVLAAGAILLAGCSSSGSSSGSTSSSGSKPYAGQSLTVETYTAVPEFDFYKSLLPQFEAQTGIKVNWVEQPVDTM